MTDDAPPPPIITPPPVHAHGLIARVQAILLRPAATWDIIAGEPATIRSIYMNYVVPLAAIGPVCRAIGMSVFGVGVPGFIAFRTPIVWSLIEAVVMYALGLVMLYVQALIIDALAPSFDGQRNLLAAFKLAAYSMTAAWIAGIFGIFPVLGILGLVGLYSCYLFWIGLPRLMKSPPEKNLVYVIVIVVVSIIASIIPAAIAGTITGMAGLSTAMAGYHSGAFGGNPAANTTITVDSPNGKASVNLGQLTAAASAMAGQASAMQNGTAAPVKVADAQALLALMPQSFMGAQRSGDNTQSGGAGGVNVSSASGHYALGDGGIDLKIADLGTMSGVGAFANAMGINTSSSSATGYDKVTTEGNRMTEESFDTQSKSGKYSIVLNGRLSVEADGNGVDIASLKAMVDGIDLGKAQSLTQ